jgi:hypothetical protein
MEAEDVFGIQIEKTATAGGVGLHPKDLTGFVVGESDQAIGNNNVVFVHDHYDERCSTMPGRRDENRRTSRRLLCGQKARARNQR